MRRPRTARDRDQGFTVVEFTIASALGALILAASAAAFVAATRAVHTVNESTASLGDVRVAMEAVTRTLRVAYKPSSEPSAVVRAEPDRVEFWALLNRTGSPSTVEPPATLVEYRYTGGCLTETQTVGATTRTTCLMRTATPPVFSYYISGAAAVAGVPVPSLPASPHVANSDLADIRSVAVSLTASPPGTSAGSGLRVDSRVTFENLTAAGG